MTTSIIGLGEREEGRRKKGDKEDKEKVLTHYSLLITHYSSPIPN
jgi:hypothetical protein